MPPRSPRLGSSVDRRPAPPVGVDAARAGCARRRRRRERGRCGRRADHHPRRRWRVRRQDRLVPRGAAARPDRHTYRSSRALARDPQRVDDGARSRPGPGAARHDRRNGRGSCHPLPAPRDPGLRRVRRNRRDPGAVHDAADGGRRLRHRQHGGPHDVGGHEHHTDRRLPRRRAPGGDGSGRTGDGHLRRRDRQGSRRGPPDQPDPEVHGLVHDHRRAEVRRGRLRDGARQGTRRCRVHRAACRTGHAHEQRATTSSSASG